MQVAALHRLQGFCRWHDFHDFARCLVHQNNTQVHSRQRNHRALGASRDDMVPFEKYANAAQSLGSPSSAARALAAGAPHIERVDRLVQTVAAQRGLRSAAVDEIVGLVDAWLVRNRRKG